MKIFLSVSVTAATGEVRGCVHSRHGAAEDHRAGARRSKPTAPTVPLATVRLMLSACDPVANAVPCVNLTMTSDNEASPVVEQLCRIRRQSKFQVPLLLGPVQRPRAATSRDKVSERRSRRRPSDIGLHLSFSSKRGSPRPFLSLENFAPQTEVAFEKCPTQHPVGDLTCVKLTEREASQNDGSRLIQGQDGRERTRANICH